MDQQYKELAKTLQNVLFKFRDYADRPEHGRAIKLDADLERLIGDAKAQKKPRSLEDQVKRIIEQLKDAGRESDEMMDYRHLYYLERLLEDSRQVLRKFSNY